MSFQCMFNISVLSTSEKLREAAKAAADEQAEQLQLMTLDIVRKDFLCVYCLCTSYLNQSRQYCQGHILRSGCLCLNFNLATNFSSMHAFSVMHILIPKHIQATPTLTSFKFWP